MSHSELLDFVLSKRLVTSSDIVDGRMSIIESTHRNTNYQIALQRRPSVFLKTGNGGSGIGTVGREATFYRVVKASSLTRQLADYLPAFLGYDSKRDILMIELVPNAETVRDTLIRTRRCPIRLATQAGTLLGKLHRYSHAEGARARRLKHLFSGHPWVFKIHYPGIRIFEEESEGSIQVIKVVQRSPTLRHGLEHLARDQKPLALIHGDFKWINCLSSLSESSQRVVRLKVIDWECASFSDPRWDVGCAFAEFLSYWVLAMPWTGRERIRHHVDMSGFRIEAWQKASRALWRSYKKELPFESPAENAWLLRSTEYAAARLVQIAFEQSQDSSEISASIASLLQLAANIFERPWEAAAFLLGLKLAR